MKTDVYHLTERLPLGVVPRTMWAQTIRESRFGEPAQAFQSEEVPVPALGSRDVLVYVMAAGVNYNNVWAALGKPVNVIDAPAPRRARGLPHRRQRRVGDRVAGGIGGARMAGRR